MRVSIHDKPFPLVSIFFFDECDCGEVDITRICTAADDVAGWADVIDFDKRNRQLQDRRLYGRVRIVERASGKVKSESCNTN